MGDVLLVAGRPIAWQRPRYDGRNRHFFERPSVTRHRNWIALAARTTLTPRPEGKVELTVRFVLPGKTIVKDPDLSNLIKLVEDALVDAGILRDDNQIVRYGWGTGKYLTTDLGGEPRTEIELADG